MEWLKMIVNSFSLLFHLPMDTVILCFNWGSVCHVLPFGNLHILNQPSAQRIFQIWHQQQNKEDKCSQGLKRTHCWWRKSLTVLLFLDGIIIHTERVMNEKWATLGCWTAERKTGKEKLGFQMAECYAGLLSGAGVRCCWTWSATWIKVPKSKGVDVFVFNYIHLIDWVALWILMERAR